MIRCTLLFALLAFFITGCSKQPEYKIIYKEKIVRVYPPEYLTKDNIKLPPPPSKYRYITGDPFQRERLLTKYVIELLITIKKYKVKLKNINDWNKKTNKILSTTDK